MPTFAGDRALARGSWLDRLGLLSSRRAQSHRALQPSLLHLRALSTKSRTVGLVGWTLLQSRACHRCHRPGPPCLESSRGGGAGSPLRGSLFQNHVSARGEVTALWGPCPPSPRKGPKARACSQAYGWKRRLREGSTCTAGARHPAERKPHTPGSEWVIQPNTCSVEAKVLRV